MEPGLGIQLFEKIKAHMGWDDVKTYQWFNTPNPLAGDLTPKEFYQRRPEKCVRWIESLIDENSPPSSGSV